MIDPRAIEWDCQRLMTRFFNRIDDRNYAGVAGLFAADGEWFRRGTVLRGPAEVLAALEGKSTTAHIRHMMSNALIDPKDADRAGGSCYVVAFSRDTGWPEQAPVSEPRRKASCSMRSASSVPTPGG